MKYFAVLAILAVVATIALARPQAPEVTIVKSEDDRKEDGSFNWAYELSDGTKADQKGYIKNPEEPDQDKRIQVLQGSFSYVQDGAPISVSYTADENGFVPSGDHLPTAPPTPEHVLKLLEIINANAANQRAARRV